MPFITNDPRTRPGGRLFLPLTHEERARHPGHLPGAQVAWTRGTAVEAGRRALMKHPR